MQDGEQLLMRYFGRKVVSTDYVASGCLADLKHTVQEAIEPSPSTAHGVVQKDYYGYFYDRLYELKEEPQGSRIVKRRLTGCCSLLRMRQSNIS